MICQPLGSRALPTACHPSLTTHRLLLSGMSQSRVRLCVRMPVCPSVSSSKSCLRPSLSIDHKKHIVDRIVDPLTASVEMAISQPPVKRMKIYPPDRGESLHATLRLRLMFSVLAVLIYAKQENEEVFHPLHLLPPSLVGLAVAVSLSTLVSSPRSHQLFPPDTKQVQIRGEEYSSYL